MRSGQGGCCTLRSLQTTLRIFERQPGKMGRLLWQLAGASGEDDVHIHGSTVVWITHSIACHPRNWVQGSGCNLRFIPMRLCTVTCNSCQVTQ